MEGMWWTKGPSADEMARLRAVLGFNDVKVLAHGRGDGAIVIAVTEGLVVLTDEVDSAVAWPESFAAGGMVKRRLSAGSSWMGPALQWY